MENKEQQDKAVYRNIARIVLDTRTNDATECIIADRWETLRGEMGDALAGDEDGLISWCEVEDCAVKLAEWATGVAREAARAYEHERAYRHVRRDFPDVVEYAENELY